MKSFPTLFISSTYLYVNMKVLNGSLHFDILTTVVLAPFYVGTLFIEQLSYLYKIFMKKLRSPQQKMFSRTPICTYLEV